MAGSRQTMWRLTSAVALATTISACALQVPGSYRNGTSQGAGRTSLVFSEIAFPGIAGVAAADPGKAALEGGALTLAIRWPRRVQEIPQDTDLLVFRVFDAEESEVASSSVPRLPDVATMSVRIPGEGFLPAGNYTLSAKALAGGTLVASGSAPVTIRRNRLTAVDLALAPVEVPAPPSEPLFGPDDLIKIGDTGFEVRKFRVKVGTTLTVKNVSSAMPHTMVDQAAPPAFDTGMIMPGGTARVRFETAGTFDFKCGFHSSMTGTVIVEE